MIAPIPQKAAVLIVEDERIVARDLQQTLSGMGYDAFAIASSADEAISQVSGRRPDLVLMDIRIKGLRDGIQTAKILKQQFDLPVVYLTAHSDEATIQKAKVTQPHGYLLKPVKSAELRSCIEVCLFKHKMERRLREREQWFSATLRSIADAVVTVDTGGRITFLNPAAEALIGLPSADIMGKPARSVLRLAGAESSQTNETPLDMALRVMRPVELSEASLLNVSTGTKRAITHSAAPVVDEDRTLGAVMIFRDVTEQKALQERLEATNRLTSLGTMAAGAAHELSNPLCVVMSNAGFAAQDLARLRADLGSGAALPVWEQRVDRIIRQLEDIQSAAGRMVGLISDLQYLSLRPQGARGPVYAAECVHRAVRATAHEFHHRARLITLLGEVPLVLAEEARLGQVIVNLLLNAAQAISPGNAEGNEVSVTTYTDARGRAAIEVRDTGTGIAPHVLARIFDPFFTTKEPGAGSGLGLSICQGIVSSFGGEITVESQVGKGSTFRILLPAASASTAAAPRIVGPSSPLQGRILVVDDEEMLLRIVDLVLKEAGHDVVSTSMASKAFALIEGGERFDAVLCDLMMPEKTGIDLYEAILSHYPDLARRMIFMTGGVTTEKADAFRRSVDNPLLDKPFTPHKLLGAVQALLARQG